MYAGSFLMVGIVIAMEFALEKKIVFLEAVPMDVCYLVMAAACIGIIMFVGSVWKKSNRIS